MFNFKNLISRFRSPIPKNSGLLRSPTYIANDPRKVYIDEVLFAAPFAIQRPDEFFSRYAVEHIAEFQYNQFGLGSCVAETGSRVGGVLEYKENNQLHKPSVQAIMAYIKSRIEKNTKYGAYLESSPKSFMNWGAPDEKQFSSDYTLPWSEFVNDKRISEEIERIGYKFRIKGYAFSRNNFDSIKNSIWAAEGNIVHGGVMLDSPGWKTGDVKAPTTQNTIGHSIPFFGYDLNNLYSVNSWKNWGLTIYLKKVIIDNSNYYYKKSNESDFDIKISGIIKLGKDYDDARCLFEGYSYMDLPNSIALKTKMYQLLRNPKYTNEVYAVDNGVKHHIVNLFSLRQGAILNHWIWKEGDSIPTPDLKTWNELKEGSEFLFLAPDNADVKF
jgi:hypothetical protein